MYRIEDIEKQSMRHILVQVGKLPPSRLDKNRHRRSLIARRDLLQWITHHKGRPIEWMNECMNDTFNNDKSKMMTDEMK